MNSMRIPRRVPIAWLHAMAAALAVAFLCTHLLRIEGYETQLGFRRLLNLDGEGTLPAWFSSALMIAASALLAAIAAQHGAVTDRYRRHWWVLSAGLLCMSADETASIHEMTNRIAPLLPFRADGFLTYPWIVIGIAISVAVGLTYVGFLRQLPPATRRGFVVAGAWFLGGALGMEAIGAYVVSAQGLDLQPFGWDERGDFGMAYALTVAAEEWFEMSGMIRFLDALLEHLATHVGAIRADVAE